MNTVTQILTALICLLGVLAAQESGQVIISEIMYNPASSESTSETQFIEIANTTDQPVNIGGWVIDDEDTDGPNTLPNITLPSFGIAVICGCSEAEFLAAWGGGAIIISLADSGQTMFSMSNSPSETNEIVSLRDNNGLLVDSVNFDDDGVIWPSDGSGGYSIYLDMESAEMNSTANNDGANWSASTDGIAGAYRSVIAGVWDEEELGSPGTVNGDNALPVELTLFTANAAGGMIQLEWRTASEVNNAGFEIWRSNYQTGEFIELSSYRSNPDLQGQGNSNSPTDYRFRDRLVVDGQTYWYMLYDVDVNGIRTAHGPLNVTAGGAGGENTVGGAGRIREYRLYQNHPNPFNPETTLDFDLPDFGNGDVPVALEVYNTVGQKVRTLIEGALPPGAYRGIYRWDGLSDAGTAMPGGIYFTQLRAVHYVQVVKMILLP